MLGRLLTTLQISQFCFCFSIFSSFFRNSVLRRWNWQQDELSSQLLLPSANNITKISRHTYCLITNIICCGSFVDKFTSEEVNSITINFLLLSPRSCSFCLSKTGSSTRRPSENRMRGTDMLLEVGALLEFNNNSENGFSCVQKLNLVLKFEPQKLII